MKSYKKKMDGFCVTYLHNPVECSKCINMLVDDEDNWAETFYMLFSETDEVLKPNTVNTMPSSEPSSNLPLKNQTVSEDTFFSKTLRSTTKSSSKVESVNANSSGQLQSTTKSSSKKKSIKANSSEQCPTSCRKINKAKTQPEHSKKISVEKCNKSDVRKQANKCVQKSSGTKIPGKGTLKRKRWYIEQLEQKNEDYEDDLFEDKKFSHFLNLLEDESDNPENYKELSTPEFPFSLSPRENTPSPDYMNCYNSEQLCLSRKKSEEFLHLKKKRKLNSTTENKKESPEMMEERKPDNVLETLLQVEKIISHIAQQEQSDSEDDQYFSDLLK